jgi:predicted metal-binding protein
MMKSDTEFFLLQKVENLLSEYPICQYGFLKSDEIIFSDKVRYICKTECPRYGKSWSCPPATGEVKDCKAHCTSYEYALVFTTLAEVEDIDNMEETLATRPQHEEIVHALCRRFDEWNEPYFALSSESCAICKECAYPHPCRYPEHQIPCIESQGILVTDAAEKCNIEYFYDPHTVTWYGILFFHRKNTEKEVSLKQKTHMLNNKG